METKNNFIITERCILRKVRKDDAAPMFRNWASDPEVTRYLTWLPHQSVEVSQMIIDSWLKDEENPQTIRFVITIKVTMNQLVQSMLLNMLMVIQKSVIAFLGSFGAKGS